MKRSWSDWPFRRRGMLAMLASFCLTPRLPSLDAAPEHVLDQGVLRLAERLAKSQGALAVGQAYLNATEGCSVASLSRDLRQLMAHAEMRGQARIGAPSLRERVQMSIRADFEHGRMVRVDHWRLSVTEVKLCALSALIAVSQASRHAPVRLRS